MECSGWCVTNETLTHLIALLGIFVAILGVWVWILDGRVTQYRRYLDHSILTDDRGGPVKQHRDYPDGE
jgi:hypothetical protein